MCHILIVGHFVLGFCLTCREQYLCKLFVGHSLRKWVAESILLSKADCLCNSVSGITTHCCNLTFVETEAVLPQYLTVIGHLYDLFFCIHAFACDTILPYFSQLFNRSALMLTLCDESEHFCRRYRSIYSAEVFILMRRIQKENSF